MLCKIATMTRSRTGLGARRSAGIFSADPFGRFPKEGGGGGTDDDIDLGSDDKDDDEDESDESDDEDESDKDDKDDDKLGDDEPPSREQFDRVVAALKKANDQSKKARLRLRELEKKQGGEPDKAAAEAEARWKPVFVRREASHALREAGLIGKPDRLLKLLDIDALDVDIDDEDGSVEIDGLDDAIADLRKEYPSLFRKRGSSAIDAADNSTDQLRSRREKRSATQRQADFLLGRG